MARRFRGSETFKVDAKGRVSIPAPFRRVIEAADPNWTSGSRPSIVIVFGPNTQQWLEVYTIEAVEEIDQQISLMQRGGEERDALQTLMYAQSMEAQIDEDGRLVLPQKLRDQIGLDGEAFFVSAGDYFKIWNPATYATVEGARRQRFYEGKPEGYDPRVALPAVGG